MRASTRMAAPPSQSTTSFSHFHSKWVNVWSIHQTRTPRPICSARLRASDHQMRLRSLGSPSWRTASSKARITVCGPRTAGSAHERGWSAAVRPDSSRSYHAGRLQLADLLGGESLLGQDLVRVLTALGGGTLDALLRTREARRRRRLREARD